MLRSQEFMVIRQTKSFGAARRNELLAVEIENLMIEALDVLIVAVIDGVLGVREQNPLAVRKILGKLLLGMRIYDGVFAGGENHAFGFDFGGEVFPEELFRRIDAVAHPGV